MDTGVPTTDEIDGIGDMTKEEKEEIKRMPSIGLILEIKPVLVDKPNLLLLVCLDVGGKGYTMGVHKKRSENYSRPQKSS